MSGAEYEWPAVCQRAISAFNGQTPGAQLEQTIIDYFEREPIRVVQHIDELGRRIAKGEDIRSGWAILKLELEHRPTDVVATDRTEGAKALRLSESWMHNAGGYLDTETELGNELFGPQGRLQDWPDLWYHIQDLWRAQRPRFIAAEAASIERQYEQAETLKRLRKATSNASPIDQDLHAQRIAGEVDRVRYGIDPHRDDYIDQLASTHEEPEAA